MTGLKFYTSIHIQHAQRHLIVFRLTDARRSNFSLDHIHEEEIRRVIMFGTLDVLLDVRQNAVNIINTTEQK